MERKRHKRPVSEVPAPPSRTQLVDGSLRPTGYSYWRVVAEKGRDLNPYRAGFLQLVVVAENDARAEEKYARHVEYFYHKCLHVPGMWFSPPGNQDYRSLVASMNNPVRRAENPKNLRYRDFVEKGFVIAGSPATVRDRLKDEVIKSLWAMGTTGKFIWPIPDKGLKKRIHRVKAPALLVWGREDRLVPIVYADEFTRRLSGSRLETVDRAGHAPHLEQSQLVSRILRDFCS